MGDVRLLALKWAGKRKEDARILVIGAGVNGSICAAGLYDAGVDVTVLARGKRSEEVRDEGIVIEDPFKHARSVTPVPVIDHLEPHALGSGSITTLSLVAALESFRMARIPVQFPTGLTAPLRIESPHIAKEPRGRTPRAATTLETNARRTDGTDAFTA